MADQKEKLEEYFEIIDRHIIKPIEGTEISKSCYATLFLLFSVIDGLGKLIHSDESANPGKRFKDFLKNGYMGNKYCKVAKDLWDLRNSMMHNGINHISYMSHTEKDKDNHLEKTESNGSIFISSKRLTEDVKTAIEKVKNKIFENDKLIELYGNRLEWRWEKYEDNDENKVHPTPPGDIRFVVNKKKKKNALT